MPSYIFILGRNQELSITEIKAVLKTGSFESGSGFLIWQSDKEIDTKGLLNQLGGTTKIGKVFADEFDEQKILEQILKNSQKGKKVFFGFSQYGGEGRKFNELAGKIKKELKEKGFSSRWVTSKEKQLSSVVVEKNKLLTQGVEILVVKNKNQTLLARTLAVQEFEEYSKRDYGRPIRDILSGTMPPKLAKIMINLAQVDQEATILDPFCGSGTILQEAILLGYKNLICTDISQKAINDTKKNLAWLKSRVGPVQIPKGVEPRVKRRCRYAALRRWGHAPLRGLYGVGGVPVPRPDDRAEAPDLPNNQVGGSLSSRRQVRSRGSEQPEVELYQLDVRQLSQKVKSVDAIITEPYLGPPLKGHETESLIKKIISELETLYLAAFKEFKKILKPNSKVVIIFPIFKLDEKHLELQILEQIKKMGFVLQSPEDLIYSRPGQKVWRQVVIFIRH